MYSTIFGYKPYFEIFLRGFKSQTKNGVCIKWYQNHEILKIKFGLWRTFLSKATLFLNNYVKKITCNALFHFFWCTF